jgi:glycine hydroxymethyltransferase
MVETAWVLAEHLATAGLPVYRRSVGATRSHQFAIEAAGFGGGQTASARLRRANLLTSGIGLPLDPVTGDVNGLRLGTPEAVRLGMGPADMAPLSSFLTRALTGEPEAVATEVSAWRGQFGDIHFTTDRPTGGGAGTRSAPQ